MGHRLMVATIPAVEMQEYVNEMRRRGLKFVRDDDVTIRPDVALLALEALDARIAGSMLYGETLTELIAARDDLQRAVHAAVEAS
jgi:hypothetical protein